MRSSVNEQIFGGKISDDHAKTLSPTSLSRLSVAAPSKTLVASLMAFYGLKNSLLLVSNTDKLATILVFIICFNALQMGLPFAFGLRINGSWRGWSRENNGCLHYLMSINE